MLPSADISPATTRSFSSVSVTDDRRPSLAVTTTGWSTGTSSEALAGVISMLARETAATFASTAAWASGALGFPVDVQPATSASDAACGCGDGAQEQARAASRARPPDRQVAPNPHCLLLADAPDEEDALAV